MKVYVDISDVEAIKVELTRLLPDVKSSHRVEAMARGLGWNTHASLRANLVGSAVQRTVDDHAFTSYLKDHGFPAAKYDALGEAVVRRKFTGERVAIQAVMANTPNLSSNGFRQYDRVKSLQEQESEFREYREQMLSPASIDEFVRACEFLEQVERRATINKISTSYGLKHRAERFHEERGAGNSYVANGMFIAAGIHLGFKVKRDGNSPNAFLNIASQRSSGNGGGSSPLSKYIGGKTRIAAWRNMMVAAINAGLDEGLFGLDADDNRWPSFNKEAARRVESQHVYRFSFAGMAAVACVGDAGFGELSFHVAVKPTRDAERFITSNNAGFLAGDAFAAGWLERKNGKWLQTSAKPSNAFRRDILPVIAGVVIEPRGYESDGKFMM